MPISALDQLTFFFRNNAYFVTQKGNAYDYIARGKLWPPIIQLEMDANISRSRDHTIVLFNVDDDIFQAYSPYKSSNKIQILV